MSLAHLTVVWVALPFFVGFSIYLLPQFDRRLALAIALGSIAYGIQALMLPEALSLGLIDHFGVTLLVDSLSGYFILTNGLVTAAVIFYCWQKEKSSFFYTQTIILHGSVNAVFICADFMSLYVALEVIGIAAFLLVAYPRTNRSIWVALRYLFISNTAMLFYLIGAILVYQAHHSFAFTGLSGAPTEAIALIFLGLLTKGGIFVSGFWLPLTHSEAETPVSALLSGVVVKTGVFPLVRCAVLIPELDPIVRLFGMGTALLGVSYAIFAKDTKRMLAFHTVSQLGFVMAAPIQIVAGFYGLTHGLVKSALFLGAGNLPSRQFKTLKHQPLPWSLWGGMAVASLSISGFPLLAGFGAKALTLKNLLPWQTVLMNLAAIGTAISFAKFLFLPMQPPFAWATSSPPEHSPSPEVSQTVSFESVHSPQAGNSGLWLAWTLLLGGLVVTNGLYWPAYTGTKVLKALGTLVLGWAIYHGIIRRVSLQLPRVLEEFDHLLGMMSVMLTLLFWLVLA